MMVTILRSDLIDLPASSGNGFAELHKVCSGFSSTKLLSLMTDWLESICMLTSGQQKPRGEKLTE